MKKENTENTGKAKEAEIMESREKIGIALRNIREKRGLNQEQLAEKMGVSRSTISKIESGKFNCSIDYLSKFAFFLDFEIILQDSQ